MNLKEKLLMEFEKNRDVTFSGQFLAEQFSVSRNAVWKAVQSLKEEGHKIESVPQKGYRLLKSSNILSKEGVAQYITGALPFINAYSVLDSTNQEAKRLLAAQPISDAVILTEEQGSRGEDDNSFDFNLELHLSIILSPNVQLDKAMLLTSATAVAIVRAIEQLIGIRLDIQWVNDIFADNEKISNILTEAVIDFENGLVKNVIIGIDLNLGLFQSKKTSLFLNRNQLAAYIYNELHSICQILWNPTPSEREKFIQEYCSYSNVLGQKIGYQKENKTYHVTAKEILTDGSLVIVYENGAEEKIRSGDIWLL